MKMCGLFSRFNGKLLVVEVMVLFGLFSGVTSISDKTEKRPVTVVIPTAVKRLDTVTLQCSYNLSGEPIYTVKWYKGSKEFYRYIPKELPNVQVFALPGITVDEQKSTHKNLVLKNVQPEVTGRYKCEVSSDAPNFYTYMQSGYMYVIDVPVEDPILRMDKEILDTGYRLKGNCSAPSSWPPANITWLLNGKPINGTYQQRVQPHDYNMKASSLTNKRVPLVTISGIELGIDENNFQGGKARISCVANVFHLYRREKSTVLDEDRPRPRPSSVLGTRDASSEAAMVTIRNAIFSSTLISILVISR